MMQTFNILQSKSKIYSNFTFTEPEIYFFRSGKRITITKFFFFFAGNPFKNKYALFG